MEYVKDLASIVGLIISIATVITLFSGFGRKFIKKTFKENTSDIIEANNKQNKDIEEIKAITIKLYEDSEVLKEASRQQLRNIIKNIYYKYNESKIIPLYERKTADATYKIYNEGLNGNSYTELLYKEIVKWDIEPTSEKDILE